MKTHFLRRKSSLARALDIFSDIFAQFWMKMFSDREKSERKKRVENGENLYKQKPERKLLSVITFISIEIDVEREALDFTLWIIKT